MSPLQCISFLVLPDCSVFMILIGQESERKLIGLAVVLNKKGKQ